MDAEKATSMQALCLLICLLRMKMKPKTRNTALRLLRTALTLARSEKENKDERHAMSGINIRIRKTQRIKGVSAMMPSVRRSNLRCMKYIATSKAL